MIWVRGSIVGDDALTVSVLDRTFEHGLGLFETLRTWNGRPTLLPRHLDRLRRSATALGLPLDPADLPDGEGVAALLRAEGRAGDSMLRITMSGGRAGAGGPVVWMRSFPPPDPAPAGGATIRDLVPIEANNPLDRHKSLNYWRKRLVYEAARAVGADEVLLATADGRVWEGSRSNLFAVERGRLLTPGTGGPMLPGIMRAAVIERAVDVGIVVEVTDLARERLETADEVFLTNSGRGIVPVGSLFGRTLPAPGTCTRRLWEHLRTWLEFGGAPGRRGSRGRPQGA